MKNFHQKRFIESIPFEDVNPDQIRQSNYIFMNIPFMKIMKIMKETFYGFTLAPKKHHLRMFLKVNDVIKESHYSTKIR